MTNFRFCRGENRTISFPIGESSRVLGEGGQFFILTQAVCFIFLMILIAHFCLIIIIAPLDPFSLRFYLFFFLKKMTTTNRKKRSVWDFFFHFGTSGLLDFFSVTFKSTFNDMEDFFFSNSHTHFSFLKYKCKIKKLGEEA